MPEKLTPADILSRLSERVRQIERQSGEVAAVLDKMVESLQRQKAAAPGPACQP